MGELPLQFKVASTPDEFEQIHRLNYKTFVEEIPQHGSNADRRLVDRFHEQNAYMICLRGDRLVGMIALRGDRPFSLDSKVPDLDSYLMPGRSLCEVRLMAVEPDERRGRVFWGILELAWEYSRGRGWDLIVASCFVRQMRLYRHLGFVPFGPVVGSGGVLFQPMYLTMEAFERETHILKSRERAVAGTGKARRRRALPATG
jgi:N-acyl-L-homoserine lactone synthetase